MTEITEHLLKRASAARDKAKEEAAPEPAAVAAPSDPRIPEHLLQRSKAAKAAKAGGEAEAPAAEPDPQTELEATVDGKPVEIVAALAYFAESFRGQVRSEPPPMARCTRAMASAAASAGAAKPAGPPSGAAGRATARSGSFPPLPPPGRQAAAQQLCSGLASPRLASHLAPRTSHLAPRPRRRPRPRQTSLDHVRQRV